MPSEHLVVSSSHSGDDVGRDAGTGKRFWLELLFALGTAAVVSLGLQWIVTRLDLPMPSFVPLAWLSLSCAVLLGLAVWFVSKRSWARWMSPVSWAGLGALGTLPFSLLLQGTPFYLHGVSQDQHFRIQYMQRLAESLTLSDSNYLGLPPFYPAGWFWVGARFANLLDMPAWAAYKPYAILTMALAPVAAFVLWSRLTRRPIALLLSVLTCLLGLRIAAYEPYSWLLAATMVPISVLAWREFRRAAGGRRNWGSIVLVGLFLGFCGATYTLFFGFFGGVLLVLAGAAAGVHYWRARREQHGATSRMLRRPVRGVLGDLFACGLIALPLVLLVWAPFLLHALETGQLSSGAAPRYLPRPSAVFPTPMFEFSLPGFICLAGTIWIVLFWRSNEIARVLGMVGACCYAWYALSFLALSMQTTLLAFRVESILHVVLFCAAGLGGMEFLRRASRRFASRSAHIGTATALVAFLGLMSLTQSIGTVHGNGKLIDIAFHTYQPNGVTALGTANPVDAGAWNDELLATLENLTTGSPEDHVMLTARPQLLVYRRYWGFQMTTVHYANPLSDFRRRRAVVESWAQSTSASEFVRKLNGNPYPSPDVFVLRQEKDGLHMTLSRGAFPKKRNVRFYDVVFGRKLFDQQHFKIRDVGPFTVAVRR